LFIYSAQVGAQRDDLADTLYGLSDMYAEQARAQQARLQAVLLPLLIVLVGCLFGFFVVGIFRPLVGLLQGDSLQG
jgi:type II secretory pathway component PulF